MINDELLAKFDCIQDLPVSEEILGAYVEGRLNGSEMREMQTLVRQEDGLSDLVNVIENDHYPDDLPSFVGDDFSVGESMFHTMGCLDLKSLALPSVLPDELVDVTLPGDDIFLGRLGIIEDAHIAPSDIHHVDDANDIDNTLLPHAGITDNYDL